MRRVTRKLLAGLAILGLLAAPAASLAASRSASNLSKGDSMPAPAMIDVLVLRPLGLVSLVAGAALWLPAAGITAMTQPSQLDVPTEVLVLKPYRFVFTDPIGSH